MTPQELSQAKQAGKTPVITLPNGRQVGVKQYCHAWRTLKTVNPDMQCSGWGHFPESAKHILAEYREGVHDRINKQLPWWGRGRKWEQIWQIETLRAARQVNQPRLRIYWLPKQLQDRFRYRLATD